jgi:hypothetical protein
VRRGPAGPDRREVVLGAVALACLGAGAAPPTVTELPFALGTTFVVAPAGAPAGAGPDRRYPLLVALHGRGEARKGPLRGGRGWPEDYALTAMIARFAAPPLTAADLGGAPSTERLAALNDGLARRPFGGLVVACPYVPDLEMYDDAALDAYGAFVTGELLPRLQREAPVWGTPATTGLDGVSLGGRVALHVGLSAPAAFGAVGGIQPAVRAEEGPRWAERAAAARRARPSLHLRLLTSDGDYFRAAVAAVSAAWTAAGVAHEHLVVPGGHDYAFNRGPGAAELLAFAHASLR